MKRYIFRLHIVSRILSDVNLSQVHPIIISFPFQKYNGIKVSLFPDKSQLVSRRQGKRDV